jgi:2-iminobutanoate/2-iminopropanoate deaminase
MALPSEIIESTRVPRVGPYSQAIRVGGIVYTAGQAGIDPATGTVAGVSFEAQVRSVQQPALHPHLNRHSE